MAENGGPLKAKKKSEIIASTLREEIIMGLQSGALKPGDSLASEAEQLARFDVSRPTFREAMRLLEMDEIVDMKVGVNGGIQVRRPPPSTASRQVAVQLYLGGATIEETFRLTAFTQAEAAARAAQNRTDEDLDAMEAVLDEAREVLEDSVAANRAYARMQAAVAEATHDAALIVLHQVLQGAISSRYELSGRMWAGRSDTRELNERSIKSMERLVDLIRKRRGDAARDHWRLHHVNADAFLFAVIDPKSPIDLSEYW